IVGLHFWPGGSMRSLNRFACLAALLVTTGARADLLDEVQKSIEPLRNRRASDEAKQSKAAAEEEKKAQKELEKAEARVKAAEEKLKATAGEKSKQEKAATQAREELKRKKESASAVLEAAKALEAASAKVSKGKHDVDAELETAAKDPSLAQAAQAVGA